MRATIAYRQVTAIYENLIGPTRNTPYAVQNPTQDNAHIVFSGTKLRCGFEAPAETRSYRLNRSGHAWSVGDDVLLVRSSSASEISALVVASPGKGEEVQLRRGSRPETFARWPVPGAVDALVWSPDGGTLLVLATADVAKDVGVRGARVQGSPHAGPDWLPYLETPEDAHRWRTLWIWRPDWESPEQLTRHGFNPWEVAWLGNDRHVVVVSDGYEEGSWYRSVLCTWPTNGSPGTILRRPDHQIACPAASPNGAHVAWIEGVASGRGGVSGDIYCSSSASAAVRLDTRGVDVTHLVWRDNNRLLFSGIRGLETVVGEILRKSGSVREIWRSTSQTICGWVPSAAPVESDGIILAVESYEQAPAILSVQQNKPRTLLAAAVPATDAFGRIEAVSWQAPDGLEIQGWLVLPPPAISRPQAGWPLLVDIHGGPISAHRNRWSANLRAAPVLASRGWAILLPNPRGSSGRGQDFASAVIGDMGGADAIDITSGIDQLARRRLINPDRVVITGNSYGGFMSGLLVTRSGRFAAAIPICPVANWTSQHFASHIGWFDQQYLGASPQEPCGPYTERSPVFQAQNVSTPTLVLGGLLDKDTPPTQAIELYTAVRHAGAPCALAMYPQEDHGLFGIPAYIDSAARIYVWATRHTQACE